MEQCPHCGSQAGDSSRCMNCGQSFDSLSDSAAETSADEDDTTASVDGSTDIGPTPEDQLDDDGLSRRALLGGAGVSLAVLGVGGAGWVVLSGGGEGRQVISTYVDAMAANNFASVPDLFHDDAPLLRRIEESNNFDDYEGYLEQREVLETWRDIEPELKGTEEFYHITEVTEESLGKLDIRIEALAADKIDELRRVVAFLAVPVGAVSDEQQDTAQYYDGGTERLPMTCTVVRSGGSWQLWTARARLVT